jgi:hypothetical protein
LNRLEFVRRVRAEQELHLQPDRMILADVQPLVVVVLQPDF